MSGVVKIDGWRVSLPDGEARAVEVRQQGADFWASMRPGGVGSCEPSPRTAIARLVASMGLDIAEILAPGQPSRAEISDTRGVEAMREACADLCDARAVDVGSNALQFAANAIRALKVAP